ncbi:hypothetical protein [Pedobacter sp. GR22-6]|uniref:hypothetical protein n=1 Tax=Pedobacter sp. GR22-6 TaxID=3127957 RepID=UPI00307DE942
MKEQKKYKIDEEMQKLNLPEYKAAIRIIPKELGIAFNTFHNYRKLTVRDSRDIPYDNVRKLEKIFGLNEGGLVNYRIECKSLRELMKEEDRV